MKQKVIILDGGHGVDCASVFPADLADGELAWAPAQTAEQGKSGLRLGGGDEQVDVLERTEAAIGVVGKGQGRPF